MSAGGGEEPLHQRPVRADRPAQKLAVSVTQLQSADYTTGRALPDGPVPVVGGGNSGLQIVQELATVRRVDVWMAAKPAMLSLRLGMSPCRVSQQNRSRPS